MKAISKLFGGGAPAVDMSGVEAANKAIAEAQATASNLAKNFKTDLSTENMAQVVPGAVTPEATPTIGTHRKRRNGAGLASQLGINV